MRRMTLPAMVCVVALMLLSVSWAGAVELAPGARSWSSAVLGAEAWYAGALPPPGLHVLDYNFYYHADEIKGRRGGSVTTPPFTDFEVSAYANCLRIIYVADTQILGANPAGHVIIPFVTTRQNSDFFRDSESGLGDMYVSPFILGWHNPPWHYVAALDVIVPTGEYYDDDIVTIGHNHWTFEPAFAVSYIDKSGFSASTKLMYDVHTKDHTLDYTEGHQFHMDYNVGYSFGAQKQWKAGICGYFLTSLEEDKLGTQRLDGSEEEVFAIGPSVAYQKGKLFIELRVQKEFEAQNRPEGIASWFKVCYSF